MKAKWCFIIFILNTFYLNAQKDSVFIYMDESTNLMVGKNHNYSLEIYIPSTDKRFSFDTYNFLPLNEVAFDKVPLNQMEKSLPDDTIVMSRSDLSAFSSCELHEYLSDSKRIYFVREVDSQEFVYFKAIYLGTTKNLQTLKMHH